MRVAVLGAAGAIGSSLVRGLAAAAEVDAMVLLDLDGNGARRVAAADGGGKATSATLDGADRQALTLVLEEYGLLINAASPGISLAAMDACLAGRCAYVDLGGPPQAAETQRALHPDFAQEGLLAILGGAVISTPSAAAATVCLYARGKLAAVGVVDADGFLTAELLASAEPDSTTPTPATSEP